MTAADATVLLASLKRAAATLPDLMQVELIRALANNQSGSYGADRVLQGCDLIEEDVRDAMRADERGIPTPRLVLTKVREIDPAAWDAAKFAGVGA